MTHMGGVFRSLYLLTLALLVWGCDPHTRRPRDAPSPDDAVPLDAPDRDGDGNGILDRDEPAGDLDGDGVLDRDDVDDDGDTLSDVDELAAFGPDGDGDGLPDHRDPDSDGDAIGDVHERRSDTDGDGIVDAHDLDSDGDGIADREEAGDDDWTTPPADHDHDGVFDFRDPDSDGDGLSDHDEWRRFETSPTAADTDGDGVDDLVETSAGTDALDEADSPRARGDFVFIVPFESAPVPTTDTLSFRTRIQLADLYFLFDRSGSMAGELSALRSATSTLIDELTCASSTRACTRDAQCDVGEICGVRRTCIEDPATASCIASPYTGAGWYLDTYVNVLGLQGDPARTASALSFGVDGSAEWLHRALWGVASPAAAPGSEGACVSGGVGCPAFRSDAVRIVVAFTDENSDGPETAEQAGSALRDAGITLIGIWAGSPSASERSALEDVVRRSGSLDRSGRPLVFDGLDAAAVPAVRAAVSEIVEGVPLRVTIAVNDEPGDDGDALAFIDQLVARADACGGAATEDGDGDGVPDTFPRVTPGTEVCWEVRAARNVSVEPIDRPQLFVARLTVAGDGSPLDGRTVYFVVPPRPPTIEVPD